MVIRCADDKVLCPASTPMMIHTIQYNICLLRFDRMQAIQ